ncbi:MAG: HAMP domain-containing sensor histidine kinase [Candidatus Pseudobacter hemicellulosilyticus]|uniref:histidine kinase n=1 Tax=Candidatus Pseudobacter hemicellulosilyticus TaxID=3121375 RepID=A0AAJ6BJM0_9BACT|nr:MAG: HAMP domain-containing sensor histidine kinase [Pseudobacter sp.]
MQKTVKTYVGIACISFLILALVQLYLVYNTYELKNERYYFSEKAAILDQYSESVKHDLLFPGGARIMDSVIQAAMPELKEVVRTNAALFRRRQDELGKVLLYELRRRQPLQQFLQQARAGAHIADSLEYALLLDKLEITVGDSLHVPLLSGDLLPQERESRGFRIGGQLQALNPQNKVVELTVGGEGRPTVSRIRYALHVEPVNRKASIIRQLSLTWLLSLFSVLVVVILFYVTFRNWLRQKKLSEMKSDFINNITHEFHTPLTAIQVAARSLQNERILEKKENISSLSGVIQRQSDRLQQLIAQVLDIASHNGAALKKQEVSVNELLEELLLDYRLQLSDRPVDMVFEPQAVSDRVWLDPFHFGTMLINILDNAVRYNDKETVQIRVVTTADAKVLRIAITDNGMGMSPEVQRHIFEKFYRGASGPSSTIKGLGLGLFYVQQQVEAHGWLVAVNSEAGTGSTFTLIIPHQNPAA